MTLRSTISKGLHKLVSSSPPKTERLLSFFLFVVISLMTTAMIVVMTQSLKKDLTSFYLLSFEQKALSLINQIDKYLDDRNTQIIEIARQPIVIANLKSSPAQTENTDLSQFLSTQKIMGSFYPQRIFNLKGNIIYSSGKLSSFYKEDLKWKPDLERKYSQSNSENSIFDIQFNSDKTLWIMSTPISVNKQLKGFIKTFIPITEIERKLSLVNPKGIQIQVQTGKSNSTVWGSSIVSKLKTKRSDFSNIKYSYGIDLTELNKALTSAKYQLMASSLILALASIGFAMMLGRWFFVRPLERLQTFASEVSKGSNPKLTETKRITVEIQNLSDTIAQMATEIYRREQRLIEKNDILKRNQETLLQAEKMAGLGQVTAGIAHEINNPIGFIMNNISTLKEYHDFIKPLLEQLLQLMNNLTSDEKTTHHALLETIQKTLKKEQLDYVINDLDCLTDESLKGTERIKDITSGLKGYAHAGEQKSLLDLNECIESTLKVVWNELKYNCSVFKDLKPIPPVECIGGQINQVLMNLFINASQAMSGKKGELQIQSYTREDDVFIIISDNGCGIKRDHIKQVFEPFYTTKPIGQGTGLGMSISLDIIKQHGGNIIVESEEGFGTSFMISLPVAK